MSYRGDYVAGDTIDFSFATVSTAAAPTTLAGSPAVSVFKSNSTSPSTAGVTLSVDFASITGLNHVRITTASDGTFYANANDFDVVITTGTVGGVSVVGMIVGSFSLANRSALRPTVATRTLDVTATGAAGIDWANVENPTTALNLSATNIDVDQVIASVSGAVGSVTGAVGSVTGNVGGNVTGSVGSVVGNVGGNVVGTVASVVGNVGGNVTGSVGSVVGAVGSVTGNVGGNLLGNVNGNVVGSVGSVAGAVGSVTGNVGGNVVGSVGSVLAGVTVTTNNDKTGYTLLAGQFTITRNAPITINFPMTDVTTHALMPGLVVTAQRVIDNSGVLAPCVNPVTAVGSGMYSILMDAADTNGVQISYLFTAPLADAKVLMVVTQA